MEGSTAPVHAQRLELFGRKRHLATGGEACRQRLVRLPLLLEERGVVLHQLGMFLVDALQAEGVVPQIEEQERYGTSPQSVLLILVLIRRPGVDLERRPPATVDDLEQCP